MSKVQAKNKKNLDMKDYCYCDFFDITGRKIDVNKQNSAYIIEHFKLRAFMSGLVEREKIKWSNVIPLTIQEEEKDMVIEYFELSKDKGKIFLCEVIKYLHK